MAVNQLAEIQLSASSGLPLTLPQQRNLSMPPLAFA
jgi:hypothetical protein